MRDKWEERFRKKGEGKGRSDMCSCRYFVVEQKWSCPTTWGKLCCGLRQLGESVSFEEVFLPLVHPLNMPCPAPKFIDKQGTK